MSSKVVRDAFELAFVAAFPGLNLEQVDNEEPDRTGLPDQWSTIDYIGIDEARVSLGAVACRRETGIIVPIVYIKAGSGSDTVIVLIESVRTFFRDWIDPSAKIKIIEVSPPEIGEESDGRWYASSTNLSYVFDNYI